MEHVRNTLGHGRVSERRACRVLGQSRSTQRRQAHVPEDEPRLIRRMTELATAFGRMDIAALRHCFVGRAGLSTTSELSVYGVEKG